MSRPTTLSSSVYDGHCTSACEAPDAVTVRPGRQSSSSYFHTVRVRYSSPSM